LVLDNVLKNVRDILVKYPESRGSDILLTLIYWSKYSKNEDLRVSIHNLVYIFGSKNMNDLTAPETISRCRRKIQADGSFLAPENIIKSRRKSETEFKRWVGVH